MIKLISLVSKIRGFGRSPRNCPFKVSDFLHDSGRQKRHYLRLMSYLGIVLIWGLRGTKFQNHWVFVTFLKLVVNVLGLFA